ncbi:hypothetical protein ACFYUD_29320 [Nocardia tengchongensis]|uniref:hypothetical protein n=1 Tax=Nocardia tengchongensis TaxID=2055889 RepID=UPI003677D091
MGRPVRNSVATVAHSGARAGSWRRCSSADTAAATPLRRIAEVDDIAAAFVFFLTQPHATATILPLDGGAVLA